MARRTPVLTSPAATTPLPPTTPYEDAVLGVLADVLGRADITPADALLTLADLSQVPHVVGQLRRTTGVDVPVADYVEAGTVAGLAAVVAARSKAARASIRPPALRPRPADAAPVLSFDQQRLWMENQLLPGSIYNVHGRRRITGRLDVPVLEASIRTIIARHETLRTRFPVTDGEPVQVVDEPDPGWRIRVHDLRELAAEARAQAVDELLDEELTSPFDLVTGPLLRCVLVRTADDEQVLTVTMHHIVSDAWSIGLFVRELTALYEAGGDPGRAGLTPLPVQYRDYAVWQRGWLRGDALEHQLDHWREHLEDAPRALALPTVQRRTNAMRAEAGQVDLTLSAPETAALHALCREHGVTSFMVLFAVFATVVGRWSGQTDVVVGVPVAGRTTSVSDRLIGFFVNLLPMRVDLSGNPAFGTVLRRVSRAALDGYAHAEAPMDELVRDLEVVRDPRRTPLFEVVLNVVGSPEAERVSTLDIEPMPTPSLFSRYDLNLTAQETDGALGLRLDFPADRCDEPTGRALLDQLRTLLAAAVADPAVRLDDVPAGPPLTQPEPVPAAVTPWRSVARHAAGPGMTAVEDGDGSWSYPWLGQAVDRVAEVLAGHPDVAADAVGVVRRPTAAFLATLVAALRAGVLPRVIETDDPALTGPLGITLVLDPGPDGVPAPGTIDLTTVLPDRAADPSTAAAPEPGRPDWAVAGLGLGPEDRLAVLSSRPGLLMSAICTAFDAGATLVVPDRAFGADAAALAGWLAGHAVTVAYLDPPVLRAAVTAGIELPALRHALVDNTGDLLPHDARAVRAAAPHGRCVGLYRVGPDGRPAAWFAVPTGVDVATAPLRVPFGRPTGALAVFRANGQPAAVGELGELRAGPDATGDLGRLRPDGVIEYAGPVGAAPGVDLTDTVSWLRQAPRVLDAVVTETVGGDGVPRLLGHVTGPDPELGTIALHNHLKARLPEYLVPSHLFVLDALPRTPWGAYDLRALPRPDDDLAGGIGYAAPRTPMERQLTEIIEELLDLEQVGVHDSFFELGGFSMLATRLVARVRDRFGVQLAVRDVFESPSVDELAPQLLRAQGELAGDDAFEALLAEIEAS